MKYRTLYFSGNMLRLIDQTLLPVSVKYVECCTVRDVYNAIKGMRVRGVPAIGIAAAYGMVLAMDTLIKPNGQDPANWEELLGELSKAADLLVESRPTAVNLCWAVKGMMQRAKDETVNRNFDSEALKIALLREANRLYEQDQHSCKMIGKFGATLIKDGFQILTYCNAGALAATELGTALAPVYLAAEAGKKFNIYCCETRPFFQGSRLTAWELQESGLKPTLLCDNAAGVLLKERIDLVIVGADRIAANGDVANKIGTYGLAVLAKYHKVPFYVAAPASTFDLLSKNGRKIPIESRHPYETTMFKGEYLAPAEVAVYNPSFDVTPHDLLTGIITDRGIISPVNADELEKWLAY